MVLTWFEVLSIYLFSYFFHSSLLFYFSYLYGFRKRLKN
uniref:Uncharacterized protein n=1 Tax=Jakoba libera TaxID=143017 RepID=M4QCH3_JAKLI|nr:hypothetical protein L048_p012 [Jakoba libera]AGH24244.1 hypothetical protein [Jakoba libera]